MQKVNHSPGKWRNVVFSLTGLLIVFADQLSKIWIRDNLPRGQSIFDIGFFRITHVHNTGAAFGMFQGHSFVLTIIALTGITVLLCCIFLFYRRSPYIESILGRVVLGLVLGGTVGNLIDRLRFGYVTDFIDFGFWPVFNIADSAVTIGVIIFAYSLIRLAQISKHQDG